MSMKKPAVLLRASERARSRAASCSSPSSQAPAAQSDPAALSGRGRTIAVVHHAAPASSYRRATPTPRSPKMGQSLQRPSAPAADTGSPRGLAVIVRLETLTARPRCRHQRGRVAGVRASVTVGRV